MRKNMLLGAAVVLAAAFPSLASAQVSGHVGAAYDNGKLHFGSSTDYHGWSGDGVAAFDLGGGLGAQVGVTYLDNSIGSTSFNSTGVDAHLYHRDAAWQWGGALGYNSTKLDGLGTVHTWTGAGEARWFMPSSSLGASLAYQRESISHSSSHSWRLAGDGRFFISDNFDLYAGLGYETLSGSGSAHGWSGDVGAEWQFDSIPISIYGGYSQGRLDGSGSHTQADTWMIGARWNFGGGTLLQRDHSGANLDHITGPFERAFLGS